MTTEDLYIDVNIKSARGKWMEILRKRFREAELPVVDICGVFGKTRVWMSNMPLVDRKFQGKFRNSTLNGWEWPNNKEFDKVFEAFATEYPNAAYFVQESLMLIGPTIYLPNNGKEKYEEIINNMPTIKDIFESEMGWMDILK